MAGGFQVEGTNADAPFTLRAHRGEGMLLLAMNWRQGRPPRDFVGFGIEYREPGRSIWWDVPNRLGFPGQTPGSRPSMEAPIQKFRWVHFPRNADLAGPFDYRVTPLFMDSRHDMRPGPAQEISIELRRETYPGKLNVTFTRGFVSSQAFVDRYESKGPVSELLPRSAAKGLTFVPTHPQAEDAFDWMGFEARRAILDVLDEAIDNRQAQVAVVAYDLGEPEVVDRLERLKSRLRIVIDDSAEHGARGSAESQAAKRLRLSAGKDNVWRQHMGSLQHNKTIVVEGPGLHRVVCGSTNFSWRGFFVQNNNAVVLTGTAATKAFMAAFEQYWISDFAADFGKSGAAQWQYLGDALPETWVAFSPHASDNAVLEVVADDVRIAESSVFYSLAFLYQTPGVIQDALNAVTKDPAVFVYGISDKRVGGIEVQTPDGKRKPVRPSALSKHVPPPFKAEPSGGSGIRLHHKFIVVDFDRPTARVYLGSYNFSGPADTKNGENLLLVRDRRVAVAYMIEAVRIFDHYEFRVAQENAKTARKELELAFPPDPGEPAWWDRYYTEEARIRDRKLFA